MQPTYTPPVPVIGNHPSNCSCSTCEGGRKRLLASSFVKRLISDMTVLHEQFYKATEKQHCAPTSELETRVLTLTDQLSTSQNDIGVLTRALDQSRKISQEREKQLAEEKRLHKLSKMSDANARGLLQQIRGEIGGDQDEPALEKVRRMKDEVISRGVACEWNAAEVVRLAESLRDSQEAALALQQDLSTQEGLTASALDNLRLAERDGIAAIESRDKFCGDLVAANNQVRSLDSQIAKAEQHRESLYAQLQETSDKLQQATYDIGCLKAETESRLPLWTRLVFAGIGLFIVAYWSHRMGFDAAMTLQGGAR